MILTQSPGIDVVYTFHQRRILARKLPTGHPSVMQVLVRIPLSEKRV